MLKKFLSTNYFKTSLIILVAVIAFYTAKHIFKFNNDSFIEETLESYIEDKTSLDVDLTPSSPETS